MLAFTTEQATRSRLALTWGVETFLVPFVWHTDQMVMQVEDALLREGRCEKGDLVVIVAGSPPGVSGTTNALRLHRVGDAIYGNAPAYQDIRSGQVGLATSADAGALVREVGDEYRAACQTAGHTLEVELAPELPLEEAVLPRGEEARSTGGLPRASGGGPCARTARPSRSRPARTRASS